MVVIICMLFYTEYSYIWSFKRYVATLSTVHIAFRMYMQGFQYTVLPLSILYGEYDQLAIYSYYRHMYFCISIYNFLELVFC